MPARKITDAAVAEIRRRYAAGEYVESLADIFDIDRSYCLRIIRGQRRGTEGAVPGERRRKRRWYAADGVDVRT